MKAKIAMCCIALLALAIPSAFGQPSVDYIQITNDADSGISSSNVYTHAIDFGTGGTATVNGVVFGNDVNDAAGGRANAGTRDYGPNPHPGADDEPAPAVTGDVASVFFDFVYNGPDLGYVELTGLTSGRSYELRLYERAWDYQGDVRAYSAGFDVGGDGSVEFETPVIDQSDATQTPPGLSGDVSYVISYVYEADASGKIRIIIDLVDEEVATYHVYGLTNQDISPPPPVITPSSAWAIAGQSFSLTATAGGTGYQWSKVGVGNIGTPSDSPVLAFDPLEEAHSGTYSVTYDDGTENGEATASYVLFVYPADTVLPLTGLIGLGLLAGACALGGASALRRKK